MAGKKGRKKRFWADDEKRSICDQARDPGVSVAQAARRYSMNANLNHKWLRDPRFASSDPVTEDDNEVPDFFEVAVTAAAFLPAPKTDTAIATEDLSATQVDITQSDRRRILIEGSTSLMAVVGLVQGSTA